MKLVLDVEIIRVLRDAPAEPLLARCGVEKRVVRVKLEPGEAQRLAWWLQDFIVRRRTVVSAKVTLREQKDRSPPRDQGIPFERFIYEALTTWGDGTQ